MSNKDFKVKNGLVVPSLSTAGIVTTDSSGSISSASVVPVANGGTGQTTTGNALNALLPLQTGNINYYLQTNGTTTQWNAITFIPMTASTLNTSATLSSNNKYYVDTSAARTLTLPASPTLGDEIYIYDASGTAATYNITIARNSNLINGNDGNLILDVNGAAVSLSYTGSTYGWKAG
jgi:hypothetical protein